MEELKFLPVQEAIHFQDGVSIDFQPSASGLEQDSRI